ncbi:MAG TPA: bifunctional precorrin-2 dehydrogenase/sirohydrochlorin ferrochelatase [Acidimicrobiia bacterium]|jgi:siroheme synthase-like protein|nr:bifunctional precorrin-2 dehydrogenase/sirohydrochlorin ferrochelatase [Acidimicrobiia bacterium]
MGRPGLLGYPVNLLVAGRRCVVIGAGRIAARKIAGLLDAGAAVHVVAPDLGDEVRAWRDAGRVTVAERPFEATDLDGAWLATAATPDPAVNAAVYEAGEARRVFVNAADDPAHCSFTLMSVVRQGDLVVTIGTGGRSPALATYLKDHVATEMGPEWGALLDLLAEEREAAHAAGVSTETLDWRQALDSGILDLVRAGRVAQAKELLRACLSSSSG